MESARAFSSEACAARRTLYCKLAVPVKLPFDTASNGSAGIQSNQLSGGTASVTVGSSTLHANAIGIQATGGASLLTYGNNQVTSNARTADRVDAVAGIGARRAVGDGDIDRAGASAAVDPQSLASIAVDVKPSPRSVRCDAAGRPDQDAGRVVEDRGVLHDQ
jgi:hypothetical protein